MIYFSEIKGHRVYLRHTHNKLGVVEDLVFIAGREPFITKAVIRSISGEKLMVPIHALHFSNRIFNIVEDYKTVSLSENELFMSKNLLDKQIIDIRGNKIVRVNDIVIQDKPHWLVAGVDLGILGIARWFGWENVVIRLARLIGTTATSRFLSWADIHPLELARGKVVVRYEEHKLRRMRPEDLADHLETTTINNVDKIVAGLDEEFGAHVITNLKLNYQTRLFERFSVEKAARIIHLVDPDEAVDVLLTLGRKRREHILGALDEETRKELIYLLELPKTHLGQRITTDFLTVPPHATVREVITEIKKKSADFSYMYYVYVLNKENQLVGVINLHELLLHDFDTAVYKFMVQNMVVAYLSTPAEIVIKRMFKYRLEAIPVIDKNKKMLGIITLDDLADDIVKQL